VGNGRESAGKFAERMLKKYGWEKGQGLGAHNDGITTAIVAKAEKRKKLADADGGGFAAPKNMGKIVGGKKRKTGAEDDTDAEAQQAGHGDLSEVIKLTGMLTNLDVDHEIQNNDLLQEIGDEMAQNGVVERLFIWREEEGGKNQVFVKFVNQLSALRALQACDGMEFADNKVTASFWSAEKFERGEYA
jgi:splicing factor 45